jgi:hypothetical protein
MDVVWATTSDRLPFPPGVGFRVSGITSRLISHIPNRIVRSSGAYKAYELIVERFGKSVKVQGNGPVSASCFPVLCYFT